MQGDDKKGFAEEQSCRNWVPLLSNSSFDFFFELIKYYILALYNYANIVQPLNY